MNNSKGDHAEQQEEPKEKTLLPLVQEGFEHQDGFEEDYEQGLQVVVENFEGGSYFLLILQYFAICAIGNLVSMIQIYWD